MHTAWTIEVREHPGRAKCLVGSGRLCARGMPAPSARSC